MRYLVPYLGCAILLLTSVGMLYAGLVELLPRLCGLFLKLIHLIY
jgi:hypothetical protein